MKLPRLTLPSPTPTSCLAPHADPAGGYLIRAYQAQWDSSQQAPSAATAAAVLLLSNELMTRAVLKALESGSA